MDVADLGARVRRARIWLPIAWIRCVLPRPDAAVDEQRVVGSARVLGDLHRRGARELVGLAGHERVERESRIEP